MVSLQQNRSLVPSDGCAEQPMGGASLGCSRKFKAYIPRLPCSLAGADRAPPVGVNLGADTRSAEGLLEERCRGWVGSEVLCSSAACRGFCSKTALRQSVERGLLFSSRGMLEYFEKNKPSYLRQASLRRNSSFYRCLPLRYYLPP